MGGHGLKDWEEDREESFRLKVDKVGVESMEVKDGEGSLREFSSSSEEGLVSRLDCLGIEGLETKGVMK